MDAWLMLALAEGGDEGLVPALLDPGLDPERALREPPCPPVVPGRVAARLRDPTLAGRAAAVRERAARAGLSVFCPEDPGWPPRLREAPLRPLVLFARGGLDAAVRAPALAFVGSRTPTPYGLQAAADLAAALARAGVVLWSGLARGVDAEGHRACVEANGPTVAVLAGGLDAIYPPEHAPLAESIVRSGGCLLSELPPGRRARRGHFPRRNRILALGAPAALVVEASLASGALHTARFAAECGGDVYALPGPYGSERSQGCHRLLAEGARIVESAESLLRDLGVSPDAPGSGAPLRLSADEQALLRCLAAGPRPADLVQRECGLERPAFLAAAFALEACGGLRRLPGDLLAAAARVTSR